MDLVESRNLAQQVTTDVAGRAGASIAKAVVSVLDVAALDITRVDDAADRRDVPFPLVRPS